MASRFDQNLANDWDRAYSEFKETIIRRVGGDAAGAVDVEAVVERDHQAVGRFAAGFGRVRDNQGERLVAPIAIELAADEEITQHDHWVVDGKVWKAIGEAIGADGGSKTIVCQEVRPVRTNSPRTTKSNR